MDKITISHNSTYATEDKTPNLSTASSKFLLFNELKELVKTGEILSNLFRYKEAILLTYDLQLITKPFVVALVLWLLSRKEAFWKDRQGASQKITVRLLCSLCFRLLRDSLKRKYFLREVQSKAKSLLNQRMWEKALNIASPPIYLRTDLCFGLQSGGSVGHIAGVLNNLHHFTGKPIFLTTDSIPTVKPDWESHIIKPGSDFWDFSEMPSFHFNEVFFRKTLQYIGDRQISFVYQRYSLNNFSGLQLAKHYKVPFVLEFNGSEIWISQNWGNKLKYEALAEQIETVNIKASDLIVVVSQPLKNQLIAKGIAKEKILVNPNGVDPDTYSPAVDGSVIRKKHHLEGKVVLGFIGTFGKWHGAEILAEAYGKLLQIFPALRKSVHLLMVGDGITMPIVKDTLSKWNVSEFCTLTGTVPQESGPLHLAACDIFISPHVRNTDGSPFFGSPTKLFEYMAMGKGIIASNLDQIGEILEHNQSAWMVKPGDVESLMLGMKTLIDDSSTRNRLGLKARAAVVSQYTWKEHTRKITNKLIDILSIYEPRRESY